MAATTRIGWGAREIRRMIETVATCTTMTTDGPQDVVRLIVST